MVILLNSINAVFEGEESKLRLKRVLMDQKNLRFTIIVGFMMKNSGFSKDLKAS